MKVRNLQIEIDKYQNSSICASQNNTSFCDVFDFNLTDVTNSFAQFGTYYRKRARDYKSKFGNLLRNHAAARKLR